LAVEARGYIQTSCNSFLDGPIKSKRGFSLVSIDATVRNRTGPRGSCTRSRRWIAALCWVVFATVTTVAQLQPLIKITGIVSDPSGAAIANASVDFKTEEGSFHAATDEAGNFTVLSTLSHGTLSISSPGFNPIKL